MTEKHIHKYIKIKVGRNRRVEYKCALPGCTHVTRPEYIPGRQSICNRCDKPFFLDKDNMQLLNPRCLTCTKSSRSKELEAIMEVFS